MHGLLKNGNHNKGSRLMAIVLCIILSISNLNGVAFATNLKEDTEVSIFITEIKEIDDEISNQVLEEGEEENKINFPDTITATVNEKQETTTMDIHVTWKLKDGIKFDSSEMRNRDSYTYEAVLPEGYGLGDKVPRPEIVVKIHSNHFLRTVTVDDGVIILEADKGVFPEDATLKVDKIEDKIDGEKIKEAINHSLGEENKLEKVCSYDIKVINEDGSELQPDNSKGEARIIFKNMDMASDEKKGKSVSVYHVDDNLETANPILTQVDAEKKTLEFNVEHFSIYTVTVTTIPESSSGNFDSILIRRGSEYGEVVADLTHSSISEIQPILVPGEEYYLCINAYSPKGDKGYVKVTLGDTEGVKVERNGLTYVNIPGNKYAASSIDHDSFDKLMKYINCDDPIYGCKNYKYNMYDGELTYNIKAEKTNGRPIYFAVGFKVDETYWNNQDLIKNALHVEMGNIGNNKSLNCTDKMDSDIGVDTTKKKTYTFSTSASVKTALDITASPVNVPVTNPDFTQVFREADYDITYPAKAVLEGVSFNASDKTVLENATYGVISVSGEKNNGDGTVTRHVKVENPLKITGSMYIGYIYMSFPSSAFTMGGSADVTVSNLYCIGYGSDEKNQVMAAGKTSSTTKYSFMDEKNDQTMIQGINRITNNVTGMANVYNWNVNRTRDNLIKTASLINSAYIINYAPDNTKDSKTVKCSYNTTDQQVNISIITMPVGLDEDDKLKRSLTVKWTGIDEAGNIKSGQVECDKVRSVGNKGYVILKADKLGIVSFKSAEADMGKIPGGYRSTGWTCNNEYNNNPCGAYGYFTDQTVGNRVKSTFELSGTDSEADSCDISCESMADSSGEPRCYFQNAITLSASGSKVVAGSSIVLNEKVLGTNSITYCGSKEKRGNNCSMVANPVVILKLPKGMSYSALSFRKRVAEYYGYTGVGTDANNYDLPLDYTVENISYKNTSDDGLSIYKITFKDRNLVIGYMDGDGNISKLIMNITLNTDKTMTTKTYDLDDIFNVTGENQVSAASYVSVGDSAPMEDIYNINGGNPLAGGRLDNATVRGISVQRLSAIMVKNELGQSKTDGVAIEDKDIIWNTYDESNPNSISFLGLNSESQYRVKVSNPSTSSASALKMVVPIPKKGENLGAMFQNQDSEFDMNPSGIDLPEGYDYKYIKISPMSNDGEMSSLSYVAADKNTANAVLITADTIKANSTSDLVFKFSIDERDNPEITGGERNIWRNFYAYTLDKKTTEVRGDYVAAEVAKGAITGTVFYDNNDNGIMDNHEETGIEGITVNAKDSSGRIKSTTTNENGRYSFNQLREDSIELTMITKDGMIYRFNKEPLSYIPEGVTGNMVSPSADRKSATVSIDSVEEDSVINASLSKICTVTYNKGNGVGETPAASEYFTGKLATVSAAPSAMYKNGYDFIGWSKVSKDAKEPDYQPGDTFVITGDVTLYALWKTRTIKITFDYQGGETTSSGYDSKYVTYGRFYNVKDINNKTWPENPTKGTAEEGWKFWKWEKPTKPVLGYGEEVNPGSISYCNEDITLRAVYSRLSARTAELNVGYGEESTEESPFYDFSKAFSIENDAEPTADNKVTYSSSSILPKGMVFSKDYSKIYGKPEEVIKDPVEVNMTVKARSGLSFTYKLKLQVQPADLGVKVDTYPKAGTALEVLTKKADINITAAVTGKLEDIDFNEGNLVTFYGQKEGQSKFEIGTGSLDADGEASCIWHADKNDEITGTYTISAEIRNLSDTYRINENTPVKNFVISDAPIITHSIHFEANGFGTVNPDDKTVIEGENYGTMPEVKRPGYSFDGWFTDIDAGEKVNEEDMVNLGMTSTVQTFYGHWTEKNYKVVYELNGGDSETLEDKAVFFESTALLPDTEVTRTGYRLNGWKVKGTDDTVTEDTMYSSLVRSDSVSLVVLEAQWTPVTYTVTYDANGGSVSGFTFRAAYESTYGKLLTPSRNGYNFKGWMDKNNERVTEDTIYRFLGDSTITAKWTPKTGYKVVYNSEGGTHVEDRTGVIWTDVGLASPRPSKYGYRFAGWKCKGIAVTDDSTYSSFAVADNVLSITLDAQWEPVESTVSFDSNYPLENPEFAGFEGNNSMKVSYGDFYGDMPESSYKGYEFKGWYTEAEEGTRVTPETRVSAVENQKLYGHWTEKKYKVSYDINGGTSDSLEDKEVRFSSSALLPDTEVTRTGYNLSSWCVKGTDQVVSEDTVYSSIVKDDSIASVVLEARWTPKSDYKIEYNTKGGSKVEDKTGVSWIDTGFVSPKPTRYGYEFKGWKYGDIEVTESMAYSFLAGDDTVSSVILEAQWEPVKTTVSFEGNYPSDDPELSGFEGNNTLNVAYDEDYGELPTAAYKGYEFEGWYTEPEGGIKVTSESKVTAVENHKLYGHWREKKYKVFYDINGGTLSGDESKEVTFASSSLIAEGEATRTGYIFNGWVLKGTDQTVTADTVYSSLVKDDSVPSVTVTAKWIPDQYTVSYDANGGIVEGFEIRVSYDSPYGPLLTPGRNGYVFNSWMDKFNHQISKDTVYKIAGDSTITAEWTPKTGYRVEYDSQGGSYIEPKTGVSWTDKNLDSPKPVKFGYKLTGWNCDGVTVEKDTAYSSLAKTDSLLFVTLTAQWEPVKSTVCFDSNNPSHNTALVGLHGNKTSSVVYNGTYGEMPTPYITGYSFQGWYTKAEGGTLVTSETKVSEVENHSLYAHWKINEYDITLPEKETGYRVIPVEDGTTVKHGDCFSFKVELEEGYSFTKEYEVKVKATGAEDQTAEDLTGDGENYTIPKVKAPVTVMVTGIEDITPPQAVVKAGDNSWNKFIKGVNYNTFFNDAEAIEVTSQDDGAGVNVTKYYVSDKELGEEELSTIAPSEWTTLEDCNGGSFKISPENKVVVYIYTEDKDGNGAYYSSDGMVFKSTPPVLSGITDGEARILENTQEVTVTDPYLKEVRLYTGSEDRSGALQNITEDGTGRVSKVQLPAPDKGEIMYRIYGCDEAGNEMISEVTLVKATHEINVDAPKFKDEEYGYEMPEAQTIEITAEGNSDTTISQVALSGENPQSFELNKSDGTVVTKGTTDNSYTLCPKASLPAGTYTARVVVTYNDGNTEEAEVSFKVNQKEAEILWGNTSFTYDGSSPQVKAEVSNLLPGDKCNVTVTMDEDNIPGTYKGKAVATGLSNSNYKLSENNRTTYSIGNGKLSGIFIKAYEGMEDNSSHDGITDISGILDTDMLKYYVSEDGNHWREWTGPEGTPQVKNCGQTMIKVVIQRQYYDDFEEVAAAKVQSKPRAVIETPVYYEDASEKITVKGRIVEGDYPLKEKTFKYRRAGDQQWLPINTIGESVCLGDLKVGSIYELELTATDTRGNTVMDYQRLQTASRVQSTIERHGDGNRNISVTLERGSTIVASITGIGKDDLFSFRNLPDGEYNVVFTDGNYKVTTLATVLDSKTEMLKARDADSKQTRVEVKKSAPDIAVYGLNELYETDLYGNNSEAEEIIQSGGNAEIKLISETAVDSAVKANIQKKADYDGREVGLYTDLKGEFVLTTKGGYSTTEEISKVSGLVLIAMPLPAEIQGKDGLRIYRSLNGEVEEMAVLPENQIEAPKEEGYYIRGSYAYIWTKEFSTYAVAYNRMAEKAEVKDEGESNEAAVDKIYDYRNKAIEDLPEYISDERRQDVINEINSVYNEGVDKIRKADGAEEADTIKRNTQSSINDLKKCVESHCIYHWLILAVLIIYLLMVVFTRKESWKYRAIVLKLEIITALLLVCYGTCNLDWWFLSGNILVASVCNITKLFLGRGSKARVKKAALKMKAILDMIILQIL